MKRLKVLDDYGNVALDERGKLQFETCGKCPYCKQITFIADGNDEPECTNCGKSIREKDLI